MTISPGARVRDRDNPGRLGLITNTPSRRRPSGIQWQVRWDTGGASFEYEGTLELVESDLYRDPYQLVREGRYGRKADLRRNLTFVHLTGRLANLVYSMGITNTDFYPHQYRPLLTLLESPCNGILIADEVGLGKTIEAGLIWTEYRARYDKKRLLVVCPAMLREKWRDELENRFGVKAAIVTTTELTDAIRRRPGGGAGDSAWIISYQSARPPKGWDSEALQTDNEGSPAGQLAQMFSRYADEHALFDMVIFDEAHTMRNRGTGSWKLGSLLRDVSECQVMLSATPINLRNDDLFSLLTLLDPDQFTSLDDLARLIKANRPLVEARDVALDVRRSFDDFMAALATAQGDPLLGESAQLERLIKAAPFGPGFQSKRYRSELAEALERVNLLGHVMTRTRKRDVQERRIERRVYREPVPMSTAERKLYQLVTDAIRQYAVDKNINEGFLLAMPQRQVCSCPVALVQTWQQSAAEFESDTSEYAINYGLDETTGPALGPLRTRLQQLIPPQISLAALEAADSKLDRLKTLLGRLFKDNPAEKVIVFTTFRPTARYLTEQLSDVGFASILIWGDVRQSKQEVIEKFRRHAELRVLIATEVAAEGVDLQFCRTVINYDLPWNPTRIEQRIGRVDRLGQTADHIFVWNLYFADTIDDRIVSRLLMRLKIFEQALGEAEAVVGETVARLEYDLLSRPRTLAEEEALIDRAALTLENVARQQQQLEENAPHMMAHGQRVLERIAAARQLSRHVTAEDLAILVRDSLARYWSGHEYLADDKEPMKVRLRLPPDLIAKLEPFLRDRAEIGKTRLTSGRLQRVVFRNNVADRSQEDGEVIHQFHPLVAFMTKELKEREEQFFPIVSIKMSGREAPAVVKPGGYAFSVVQWSFTGVIQEEWLIPCVVSIDDLQRVDDDIADQVLQAARMHGHDWLEASVEVSGQQVATAMELADLHIDARFADTSASKQAENADRVRFQEESVRRHSARRMQSYERVILGHRQKGRESLMKATQGQQRHFLEKMELRLAAIRAQQRVNATKRFVCGGVIRVD